MASLKWSTSHVVSVPAMDDEHEEILETVAMLQTALSSQGPASGIHKLTETLASRIEDHFAHEERLMRAARYSSLQWHKKSHDGARKRVGQFLQRIGQGDTEAAPALIQYLTAFLNDHMRLQDMMLGAFLRNHRRSVYKMSFRAGTKAPDACSWFDSAGDKFDPSATRSGF